MRCLTVSFIAVCLWLYSAEAQQGYFKSGNMLHQSCRAGLANEYIAGVVDTHMFLSTEPGKSPRLFCLPAGSINTQAADIVCKYLADHPEQRHYSASTTAIVALNAAFPCAR